MIFGVLFIGMGIGLICTIVSAVLGLGLWVALFAYPLGGIGTLSLFVVAQLLCQTVRSIARARLNRVTG